MTELENEVPLLTAADRGFLAAHSLLMFRRFFMFRNIHELRLQRGIGRYRPCLQRNSTEKP